MDKETALDKMKEQQSNHDIEQAHSLADDILCDFLISLGHEDLVREYFLVDKWYS